MKARFVKLISCSLALAALSVAGTALADPIQGYVWAGATYYPNNLSPTPPSGAPTTVFTISNPTTPFIFNFFSSTDGDLTNFLTNNGTNNDVVTYATGYGDQGSPSLNCPTGTTASCGINNDVMEFTGSTYLQNGSTYSFTHDDGMYLDIGGSQVISSGAPTSSDTSRFVYTGASGLQSFSLLYGEVNGAPAVLDSPDFGLTPEPSSLLLLGTGLAGMAFLLFRKRQKPVSHLAGSQAELA